MKRFREPGILFLLQVVQYSVVCFSYRALAQANIPVTVGVDLFYAVLMFTVIQKVSQASKGWMSQIGYALGSATGSYIGIITSLAILGK